MLAYEARQAKPLVKVDDGETKESDLHDKILNECRRRGWIAFHGSMAHRTYRTGGEPDFTIVREHGEVLFVECKSKTGKLSPEQSAMMFHMNRLGCKLNIVRSFAEFIQVIGQTNNRKI